MYFVFLTCKADDKKKIKEIVCRSLAAKGQAKKLVEDYNSRYGKVNHFECNSVLIYNLTLSIPE